MKPNSLSSLENFQPDLDHNTIFIRKANHIGNGTNGYQVQHLCRNSFKEGSCQFESYTTSCQILKRIIGIWMLWMDNGIGIWKLCRHTMVVCNDNVHTLLLRISNSFISRNPIVHRDNQGNALLLDKVFIDTLIGTIAVCKAVG